MDFKSKKDSNFELTEKNQHFFKLLDKRLPVITLEMINDVLRKYDMTTEERAVHFLVQCMHESGGFQFMTEIAPNGEVPETYFNDEYGVKKAAILGNTKKEEGFKYRGFGAIQLTGKYNFQKISSIMNNKELLDDPEQFRDMTKAENLSVVLETSTAFWKWKNLNKLADEGLTEDVVKKITKIVNGERMNGLDHRLSIFRYYMDCRNK